MAYEPYLELLGELRPRVQEQVAEPARRKALWESLLDSDVLDLLRDGQHAGGPAARRRDRRHIPLSKDAMIRCRSYKLA